MWKIFLTYDKQGIKLYTIWKSIDGFAEVSWFNPDGSQFETPYQSEAQELADKLNGDSDEKDCIGRGND